MRVLTIETASEACSVALFEGAEALACDHRLIGRGHAEALIPMIAGLPDKGRAQRILVSLGPGSFTGVRIGIAAARALGLAWRAQVLGFPTLALIAAMARAAHGAQGVTVCTAGGHGEWFWQNFGSDGMPQDGPSSLAPQAARERRAHRLIAGNRAAELAALLGPFDHIDAPLLPDAAASRLLADDLIASDLAPIYGRAPDARVQHAPPRADTPA